MATFIEQAPGRLGGVATLRKVDVGDTFTAEHHDRTIDFTVAESCGNTRPNSGAWYCVTHDTSFRNNIEKDGHIGTEGDHTLAWVCLEHGPEVP